MTAHSPPASFGADAFRNAMRAPASSVVVVATGVPGQRAGCTVTAICSLSDSPPSLLVCLNRKSSALAEIARNRRFSANYLGTAQAAISDIFAGRTGAAGDARFAEGWTQSPAGLPLLQDAAAQFECELERSESFGSHDILIGRVIAASGRDDAEPLVYSGGLYRQLAPTLPQAAARA